MKEKIRLIVDDTNTKKGKIFAFCIQFLIIVSVITFSIETIPSLATETRNTLHIIEFFCVIIFTVEYVLRLYASEKKLKFIFSFFGIIDVLAILPFYLSFGIDLRSVRAFRLFRLFRILKLVRYNKAIKKFGTALKGAKEELLLFFFITLIILFLSAVGIYYFENEAQPENFSSVFDSLWWSIVTLTTVGYGDVYPITVGGKVFTFVMLIVGLGIIAIPAGIISSALSTATLKSSKKNDSE